MHPHTPTGAHELAEPWLEPWPEGGLEAVRTCPMCGSAKRKVWHDVLRDNTFRTARGVWKLWQCQQCSVAYLDPRPNPQTIHLAYGNYYTHEAAPAAQGQLSRLRRLRLAWTNGYIVSRYGVRREPAARFGKWAAQVLPFLRKRPDREFRHLPPGPAGGKTVLDVGCGDGAFLALVQAGGWQVLGLEPDPKAAAAALKLGVSVVEGGLERLQDRAASFDVVTLAHVIEHVHDPVATLQACLRLLKPGGRVWIETPNADSLGHRWFGANWRGIEAPRHLVLFTRPALVRALKEAGFKDIHDLPSPSPRRWLFQRCLALRDGRISEDVRPLPRGWWLLALAGDLWNTLSGRSAEFLTVSARRPA